MMTDEEEIGSEKLGEFVEVDGFWGQCDGCVVDGSL